MQVIECKVIFNTELGGGNHLIKLTTAGNSAFQESMPGQFVQASVVGSSDIFLRRPFSIHNIDSNRNELWLLVKKMGIGTQEICNIVVGGKLSIIYPLGKGFSIPTASGNYLLIGGGIGLAPLLFLGKKIKENGLNPFFLLGGRSERDIVQRSYFEQLGEVCYTTEDGSLGEKGFVTDHPILQSGKFDYIYSCGPKPMMVAVARYAASKNIECEVSLENSMACGIGACLCCVEKSVHGNVCICTEGPVFNIKDLTWLD